jgi:hypothetical protein
MIALISIFLTACSQETSKTTGIAPEGMNQEFYEESVEVLKLINNKMVSSEKMSKRETEKIESYFKNQKGTNTTEFKVYSSLAIIHPTYEVFISTENSKEKEKINEQYNSDYQKLSSLLNIN